MVTIEAEDAGRKASNRATALVEVRVLPPPFVLKASPSTVTLASGSNRLNAANAVVVSLVEDDHLLGTAEYTLAGSWAELGWFDVVPGEGNTAVISLNRVLDYHAIDAAVAAGNKLIQLEVRMRDSGRAASSLAEMVVDVVVTLTSAEEPLSLWPTRTLTSVSDGGSVLSPTVSFLPNALGEMSYEVLSATSGTPDVDWFEASVDGQGGTLRFKDGRVANYAALTGVGDLGSGKPVVVTVRGTDAGRTGSNTADVSVTVDVRASALALTGNPATLNVVSGSAALTSGSTPTQGYTVENRIGVGRYTLAGTTPFVDWFAIDGATGELSLERPADYSLLPGANDGSDRTVTATVQLMDVGRQTDNVATTAIEVRVQAPTVLTLLASESATTVADGSQDLSPSIQFSTQGAADASAVTYTVDSVVPSGASWFGVTGTGALEMTSAAVYSELGNDLVASSDGAKTVAVTVKAEQGGEEDTLTVSVRVRPSDTAFILSANSSEAYVMSGTQTLDREVTFTPSSSGTVTYAVATEPSGLAGWFSVSDTTGELSLDENADYDTAVAFDDGTGRPVTVTVTATEGGGAKAAASVVVRVLPPALTLTVSSPVEVMHGLSGADIGATATATGVVGVRSYIVTPNPFVDWFRLSASTGEVSVRPDRTVDWNALSVTADEEGKKAITLTIRLTDSGRSPATGSFQTSHYVEATLTVNVNPAPLVLGANQSTSFLDHGDGAANGKDQVSTGIVIKSQNKLGTVTYALVSTPAVEWFEIDGSTGDLRLQAGVSLDYDELPDSSTTPRGRPVYLTITGVDDGRSGNNSALISAIVYVKPPPFIVTVDPTEVLLIEGSVDFDEDQRVIITAGRAIGELSVEVTTSPHLDWFEVIENGDEMYLALKDRTYVDPLALPSHNEDEEGRRPLTVYITARDTGRVNTPASVRSDPVTVKIGEDTVLRLNAWQTEFFEKSQDLSPTLEYDLTGADRNVPPSWSGDVYVCDSYAICSEGFRWTSFNQNREGRLLLDHSRTNFWATKDHYEGRGDDERFSLYQRIKVSYRNALNDLATRERWYIVDLKNRLNDERIGDLGDFPDIVIQEGNANSLFFFPISQKLSEDIPLGMVDVVASDERFTLRNIGFRYVASSAGQIGDPQYNLQGEPWITNRGQTIYEPCGSRTALIDPGCRAKVFPVDLRLTLAPGEVLTYDPEAEPIRLSLTIRLAVSDSDIESGSPKEVTTNEFTVTVIQRQDGTSSRPFLIDEADELRSLAVTRFRNDYTEAYCDLLPTCVGGALGDFQTVISHYSQTKDIDLEGDWQHGIGGDSDDRDDVFSDEYDGIPGDGGTGFGFHGAYRGNGYEIRNLHTTTAGGLFSILDTGTVIQGVHLRDVDINIPNIAGGIARIVDRYSYLRWSYWEYETPPLTLPYFDFYFASKWNFFNQTYPNAIPNIFDSSTTGSVVGTGIVGGLVGAAEHGSLYSSYSTADVTARLDGNGNSYAGGIVGRTGHTGGGARLRTVFATGDVTAGTAAGGLVGTTLLDRDRIQFCHRNPL